MGGEFEQDRPGKVFVAGLAVDVDEKILENCFDKFGRITEVLVIREKNSQQSRGYGFVTFENPLDGEAATKGMDGKDLNGKVIHVEQAVRPQSMRRGTSMRGRGGFGDRRPLRGGFRDSSRGSFKTSPRDSRDFSSRGFRSSSSRGSFREFSSTRRGSDRGMPMKRGRGTLSQGPSRRPLMKPRYRDDSDDDLIDRSGMSEFSRHGPPEQSSRRFSSGERFSSDRGPPPRSRDGYRSTPPRDMGRGPPLERMNSRGYLPPPRESYSSRNISSREDYMERPSPRDRSLSSRDFIISGRDSRGPPSRSMHGSGKEVLMSRPPRDGYSNSRDYGNRDMLDDDYGPPPSRSRDEYGSSRSFARESNGEYSSQPSRVQRGEFDRDYDSYRDSMRSSAPASRSYGMSSREPQGPTRSAGPAPRNTSGYGPPNSRSQYSPPRGQPTSRGPPQSSRGQLQSSRGPPQSSRGPPPSSRGPPPRGPSDRREERIATRRPLQYESRGGPPPKRPKPDGPPRGGPPFRR